MDLKERISQYIDELNDSIDATMLVIRSYESERIIEQTPTIKSNGMEMQRYESMLSARTALAEIITVRDTLQQILQENS